MFVFGTFLRKILRIFVVSILFFGLNAVFSIYGNMQSVYASVSDQINRYSPYISTEKIKIGGIGVGDTVDYVKSIYGEPTKIGEREKNYLYETMGYDIFYGDSFKLYAIVENDGVEDIVDIMTTANNGIAMPCGIKVGSSVGEMYKNFGMPFRISKQKDGSTFYVYRTKYTTKLLFIVDKNHTIRTISIVGME